MAILKRLALIDARTETPEARGACTPSPEGCVNVVTIHAYLPEEAVDCWYPAQAESLGNDLYRIVSLDPADPALQHHQGDVVGCHVRTLSGDGGRSSECLVAYEAVTS